MRRFLILSACLIAAPAFAQQREAGLSAEATETIRLQPDTAKIYFVVETKDPDANAATEANTKLKKDLTDALEKLAIKNLATKATQKTVSRERESSRIIRGGGGGFPGGQPVPVADNVSVSTPIILTLTNSDSIKLVETVEKILQSAASVGISGANTTDNRYYSPFDQLTSGKARVVYSTKAGWDESVDAALAKATARAKAKAVALAKGAGVTLGSLVTVQELGESTANSDGPYYGGPILARSAEEASLVDGELTRTIRVRVTYAVK